MNAEIFCESTSSTLLKFTLTFSFGVCTRHMDKSFPGGSKNRVNRAGENVRLGTASLEDIAIIEEWRAAHRTVLNTFQASLRNRTRGTNVTVAQRLKRRTTIFDKLSRYQTMNLVRMDDVAGCRLIFETMEELYDFREKFHRADFKHKRRNEIDKYDYIKHPKESGYRGVHDVFEYDVKSRKNRHLSGLYVEIQYRTLVQHAWATTVEVLGFITKNQPKFNRGDERFKRAMRLTSEILARAYENKQGPVPGLTNNQLMGVFERFDEELNLVPMLRTLQVAQGFQASTKNAILMYSQTKQLRFFEFENAVLALKRLFELEKIYPQNDVVFVRGVKGDDVRLAFNNYFSDTREFVELLQRAGRDLCVGNRGMTNR